MWSVVETAALDEFNKEPSPRIGCSLTYLDDSVRTNSELALTASALDEAISDATLTKSREKSQSPKSKNHKVILFGGASHEEGLLNDLFVLDLDTLKWTNPKPLSSPPPRYEHAAVLVPASSSSSLCGPHEPSSSAPTLDSKTELLIFGGSSDTLMNDVWVLDVETMKWTELVAKAAVSETSTKSNKKPHQIPQPRTLLNGGCYVSRPPSHADNGTEKPSKNIEGFYLFGGGGINDTPVDDVNVWRFCRDTLTWHRIQSTSHPPPRLGHTLTCVGTKLYLFGGMSSTQTFNDLWCFDVESTEWTQFKPSRLPSPRTGHSCIYNPKDKTMYIYGGMTRNNGVPKVLDDLWCLDVETNTFTQLAPASLPPGPPGPSLCHSMVLTNRITAANNPEVRDATRSKVDRLDSALLLTGPETDAENSTNNSDNVQQQGENAPMAILYGGMDLRGIRSDLYAFEFV